MALHHRRTLTEWWVAALTVTVSLKVSLLTINQRPNMDKDCSSSVIPEVAIFQPCGNFNAVFIVDRNHVPIKATFVALAHHVSNLYLISKSNSNNLNNFWNI